MNELKNSINTLFNLQTQIHLAVETLNEIGNNYETLREIKLDNFFDKNTNLETSSHTLISSYAIILFCSFMDEYEKYFNQSELEFIEKERILRVKRKNSPGIKRIKKWKDLKKYRNYLAAHNFRINGKSFFSNEFEKLEFKIPNTISEKNLFSGIIYIICQNIKNEFPEIIQMFNINERMIDKISFIGEQIDNEKELSELYELMI